MTSEGVRALCDEGGFKVVALLPQGGAVASLFQIVNFIVYGVLGRLGAPVYAALNAVGQVGDRLVCDTRFSLNHVCVCVKPASNSGEAV